MGLRLIDPKMNVLTEIPRSTELSAAHGFPQMNMFDQPELEAMLRANVKRYPQVTIHGNVEVTAVSQNQNGRVRVSFLDRVRGGEQSVQATMCWAATAPTASPARPSGRTCTGCRSPGLAGHRRQHRRRPQPVGGLPPAVQPRAGRHLHAGVRHSLPVGIPAGRRRDRSRLPTLAAVEPLIRPWLGDTPIDAFELVRVTAYTFRAQVASRWRNRNVFLLGDAAHLTPPFVGQGLAAGLRDAMNLTWKLVGVLDGTLPESVLDTYEQERELHAAAMILMAVSMGAAMTGGGRIGDLIRHTVLPRIQNLRLPGTRVSAPTASHPVCAVWDW